MTCSVNTRADKNRSVYSTFTSGRYWARTSDLLLVRQALYQLS